MTKTAALFIGSSLLFSQAAISADVIMTASELATRCESNDASEQAECWGYILGAVDSSKGICISNSVKHSTVKDLVVSYLKDVEEDDAAASSHVQERLEAMFPCSGKKHKNSKEQGGKGQNWSNSKRIGK